MKKLERDLEALLTEESSVRKDLEIKKLQLQKVLEKINHIRIAIKDSKKEPEVTDHALIRYLERVNGFDVEGFRRNILTPALIGAIKSGAQRYKSDGIEFAINGNKVVTVVTPH